MGRAKVDVEESAGAGGLSNFESRLTNLLGLLLIKDVKQQGDQILLLHRAGFKTAEIAALVGTTNNTVSVAVYQQKNKKK